MMAQGGRCMKTRIILRFFVAHITHVSCEEYSITHGFKAILWHEITPTTSGIAASARAGQNSEPRSSLWWARGGEGRGENNYNSHDASLPTKHAANKNKDRPFHKTLRNYYENVRPKQLHNVHCASLPMDIRILSPHQHTNHHENHRIYDYDSLRVWLYLNIG